MFGLNEGFLFGGLSPPNKKINPLRSRRLVYSCQDFFLKYFIGS